MKSNILNEIKKLKTSGMVFNCPEAAMQHHNHKIAVLWCYNDDLGQGNNSWNWYSQIKDKIGCIYK